MIRCYRAEGDHLVEVKLKKNAAQLTSIIWLDLLEPTKAEEKLIETWLKIPIPTQSDAASIEESNRFYIENGALYLTAPLIYAADYGKRNIMPITFILSGTLLITIRYSTPKSIESFIERSTKAGNGLINNKINGMALMLSLIEAATDRLAELLEAVSTRIEQASRNIFDRHEDAPPMSTKDFRKTLRRIGSQGTFLSMVQESIAGISRLLVYLESYSDTNDQLPNITASVKSLERDTQSLEHYANFLSTKMTFLLDTIVGMISTEQNAIIKIFSVAAVGFMPPTLVASIYGMNFKYMPELNAEWGYPMALILMLVSAILPLLYFRKKGWL